MLYTMSNEYIYSSFFVNVLDRMIEEIYNYDLFEFQNVTLFKEAQKLADLSELNIESRNQQIKDVYNTIISNKNGLFAEISAATGITPSCTSL